VQKFCSYLTNSSIKIFIVLSEIFSCETLPLKLNPEGTDRIEEIRGDLSSSQNIIKFMTIFMSSHKRTVHRPWRNSSSALQNSVLTKGHIFLFDLSLLWLQVSWTARCALSGWA
jgi:hypothetical protein